MQPAAKNLHWLPLDSIGFPQLFFQMFSGKQSGLLHLADDRRRLVLVFYRGVPVFANSNAPDDQLGPLLLAQNAVTPDQLQKAVEQGKAENKRLAAVLVQTGVLDSATALHFVKEQLKMILYKMFAVEGMQYAFEPQELGQRETIALEMTPVDLIVEGVRRHYSLKRILHENLKPHKVLKKNPQAPEALFEGVRWNPTILKVLEMTDGQKTIQQVMEGSGEDSAEVLKALYALITVNRLMTVGETKPTPAPAVIAPAPTPAPATGGGPQVILPAETAPVDLGPAAEIFIGSSDSTHTPSAPRAGDMLLGEVTETPPPIPAAAAPSPMILGDVKEMAETYEKKKQDLSKVSAPEEAHSEGEITMEPDHLPAAPPAKKPPTPPRKAEPIEPTPAPEPVAKPPSKPVPQPPPAPAAKPAPAPPTTKQPAASEGKIADLSTGPGLLMRLVGMGAFLILALILVVGAVSFWVYYDPVSVSRYVERVRLQKMYGRSSLDARRLGQFYVDDGQLQQAKLSFQKALKQNPGDERVALELAEVQMQMEEWAAARAVLEAVVAKNPTSAQAHLDLGWCALHEGDPEKARKDFTRYLSEAPVSPQSEVIRKMVEGMKTAENGIDATPVAP